MPIDLVFFLIHILDRVEIIDVNRFPHNLIKEVEVPKWTSLIYSELSNKGVGKVICVVGSIDGYEVDGKGGGIEGDVEDDNEGDEEGGDELTIIPPIANS